MSRIHEALKRAQQQRELTTHPDQPTDVAADTAGLDTGVTEMWTPEQPSDTADAAMLGMEVATLPPSSAAPASPEPADRQTYGSVLLPGFENAVHNNGDNGVAELQDFTSQPVLPGAPSSSTSEVTQPPSPATSDDGRPYVRLPEEIASVLAPSGDGSQSGVLPPPAGPISFARLRDRCSKPVWKPDLETMLFLDSKPQRKGSEEFRSFRTRLYQLRAKQALTRILVSSPLPSEGKTFVAANLAQVLARQYGRRVLLIDGDLRLSSLHRFLGAPSTPGLTDYLRGAADVFSIMQMAPTGNLYFIPGGTAASNASELIALPRLRQLFEQVSACFDWVIVDSPPVIPIADAVALANHCDGVVLVINSGTTPFEMAAKSCQDLRHRPLLGVVLNRVAAKASSGRYYYEHYAYGKKR